MSGTLLEPSTAVGIKRTFNSPSFVTLVSLGDSVIDVKNFKNGVKGIELTVESDEMCIDIGIPSNKKSPIISIKYDRQAHHIYPNTEGAS